MHYNLTTMKTIHVPSFAPKDKHPKIFEMYDSLLDGETMLIENDHDPLPLYYQMIAERGPVFTWEYVERGPEDFKVQITKTVPQDNPDHDPHLQKKVEAFQRLGVDHSCKTDPKSGQEN